MKEGTPLKKQIYFGPNYLVLSHSLSPVADLRGIIGPINVGMNDLKPVPDLDEDPNAVTQRVASEIAERVENRLGCESGSILSVSIMPFYFSRPMRDFPNSEAAAWASFRIMSKSNAKSSIVVATTSRIWSAAYCAVTEHQVLTIPMKLEPHDDEGYYTRFMDRSGYEEAYPWFGRNVSPYFLRMAELFTDETWQAACPRICTEIARRACRLMIA